MSMFPGEAGRLPSVLTLPWLRLLRWTAVAGQTVTVLVVVWGLRLPLPLAAVFGCIVTTALSNLGLHFVPPGRGEAPPALATILAADVMLLTLLLHFSGGPHNPFSSFYLVHVALAAVALPPGWVALVAGLGCTGYGLLFLGHQMLPLPGDVACGIGPNLPLAVHLRGMLVAFVLTAAAIVFFAGRLQQALRRREAELAGARQRAAQNERFAALATLAAGAAHELGSPLGTIAVAAGEVVRAVRAQPGLAELADDADLIREEVARCRAILNRLESQSGDAPREIPAAEIIRLIRARFPAALEFRVAPEVPTVYAPPEAFRQALVSLVQNAFDAGPPGQTVSCFIRRERSGIRVQVFDRGEGLSPAASVHAGEPFFTTKPPGRGTGLGLFLVRMLAERIGGSFQITSTVAGTTAALYLPHPHLHESRTLLPVPGR
jgi:two-component system sensor histidine kinase RegB